MKVEEWIEGGGEGRYDGGDRINEQDDRGDLGRGSEGGYRL